MKSIWTKSTKLPSFEPLEKDIKTDVLIVGGGIAGLLCAYMLREAGVDCTVAEARRICSGVTKNTTAKITAQHGLIYKKLTDLFGKERARMYLEANLAALSRYKELCCGIDCGFRSADSYVYSTDNPRLIEEELSALSELGFDAELCSNLPPQLSAVCAVRFKNQANFNPLDFLGKIAEKLRIYEKTEITEITPKLAVTDKGFRISAENIIVATHFPIINKQGLYFMKMYQERSYAVALRGAPKTDGMYIEAEGKGFSLRSYGEHLIVGGGNHRTGEGGCGWEGIENFSKKEFPSATEVCRWATQDCITLDGVAYVGRYSKRSSGLYVATGFNKWGMTSSMAAAELLRDIITGKDNPYAELFSPQRAMYKPKLLSNIAKTAANMITPTAPRCSHLGCALKYNSAEHTWDCSCHGSRFTEDGKLIENPATKGIGR